VPRYAKPRRPASRGLFARTVGILLGVALAGAGVVAMQAPWVHKPPTLYVAFHSLPPSTTGASLAWPSVGSAAVDIPSLGVVESHDNAVVPIASLTKMMTVYVALKDMPLSIGETGPCHTVTSSDVETFNDMSQIDESSVPVKVGEQLCESDLLEGVLVHSAGNYAVMLANMVAGSNSAFIQQMNGEAAILDLTGTSYADVTGFSAQSVSTALDQVRLAALLMQSPLVRSIVILPSVTLPFAGVEPSYTPDVGTDNVIGVKSGRTEEAGGCDAMAMTFQDGSVTHVAYVVVLGQRGGDLLTPAGNAALALANSAVAGRVHYTLFADRAMGEIAYPSVRVGYGLTKSHEFWWWPAQHLTVRVHTKHLKGTIRRGEVVGSLVLSGAVSHTYLLRAYGDLSPPSLLERLR
jgi:serine-type D-Ala-D-Ala carboxypeptidase (penicillin-binding protein 5/6)